LSILKISQVDHSSDNDQQIQQLLDENDKQMNQKDEQHRIVLLENTKRSETQLQQLRHIWDMEKQRLEKKVEDISTA
jgi:hypothetical protein